MRFPGRWVLLGLAGPVASQVWAGMEDASRATSARVSYLAVTGPATQAQAAPFAGTLLVRGCKVVVVSGAVERAAVLGRRGPVQAADLGVLVLSELGGSFR